MRTAFRERMILLKDESGITWRTIEERTGLPYSTLQSYMVRDVDPRAYSLIRIARVFGVSIDWLLGLTEEREINERRILPEEDDRTGRSEDQGSS
jgi:transcriptional regulator with XRE-family HTH domain